MVHAPGSDLLDVMTVAGDHPRPCDAVLAPGRGALGEVEHHRRQPIDRHHEPRLGGVAAFVLVPQLAEPLPGRGRQQREQTVGRGLFAGLLRGRSFAPSS